MEDFCPAETCNVMELLPFFLDIPLGSPPVVVPPSRILTELQMPMQKRFEQLTKPTRKRRIVTEYNTFIRNPDIVVFQNYEAYQMYKTTLTFVNTKPISKNLKLHLDFKSPFFEIVRPPYELDMAKVAPGIAYVVTIVFKPTEMKDYVARLVCDTNEETIIVPLYGIGTRPLLQIVDEIKLNPTAVRVSSEKPILLHNIGTRFGHYRVSIEEPFNVEPKKEVIESKQANELKVSCTPISTINPRSHLIIHCEDIVLQIPASCEVEEAEIVLQKCAIDFFEVYVGLQNYGTTTVYNKSPFTVDFRWKLLESEKDDIKKIKSLMKNVEALTEMEKLKYASLEYNDVINSDGHAQILDYKFREFAESVNEEFKLMYTNEAFSIIPLEGKILPHQSFDFNIIFSPSKNEVYLSSAYLDVTGKHNRFRLYLSGIGRGPSVVFNVNKLNTGTIFLEAIHEYQVVVKNEGCVPATVVFQKKETEFGGEINCKPPRQYLKRIESCKTFIVSFTSGIQGPFIEKVHFKIKESNEIIYFLLIGNVVCPLLKPDVEKLDFGKIAFGSEIRKKIVLTNPSQVPIDFQIKMSKINYSEMIYGGKKEKKADFTYSPDEGVVAPYGNVVIEVKLLTNVIDIVKENLIIKMHGSDLFNKQIPCMYTCLIPTITCEPKDIYITFCFLNFVYKRILTFTNTTSLTGQLTYTPIEPPTNMKLELTPNEIYITPHGVFEVELTITTDVLGLHEYPLMFTLTGQEKPTRWCILKCNGQGPVVSYFPDDINFGKIQLLTRKVRKMSFVNDSPIHAKIFLSTNNKAVLQFSIEQFDLSPECEMNVDVTCFLTEDGKFDCSIFVDVENGENNVINVCGEGIGYPIECLPKLEPVYDLGSQLIYLNNKLPVSISNLGKKYYRIYWSRKPVIRNLKELTDEAESSSQKPVFSFEPHYLELGENCTEQIDIYACSRSPSYFEETFYMQATIDPASKQVILIMTVLLKVKFIVPLMSFSTTHLNFMEMHVPEIVDPLCPLDDVGIPLKSIPTGEVTIKNEVEIPLNLRMQTTSDFFIKSDNNELLDIYFHLLDVSREITVSIEFKPLHDAKRYVKGLGKLTVNIPEYPKTESIFLTGEMCFPSIQFLPPELNFGCLAIGSSGVKSIIIQNITFLPVKYSIDLSMDTLEIEGLPRLSVSENDDDSNENTYSESSGTLISSAVSSYLKFMDEEKLPPEVVESERREFTFQLKRRSSANRLIKPEIDQHESTFIGSTKIEDGMQSSDSQIKDSKLSLDETAKLQSEQFMKKTSFQSSTDLLVKTLKNSKTLNFAKVGKVAKELLTSILYVKQHKEDEKESRDFWIEMKRFDVEDSNNLSHIITIEPWRGCLKPYEYGLINISFHPPPNTRIQCTAICKIEGGEHEPFNISGSCSNLAFSFDKNTIEVGKKLFCEIFEETITLTNNGYYEFPVKVQCNKEEIFFNKKIKPKWLNVYPAKYYLEAGKSVTFDIRYFPGMTGPFEEQIVFELDFLDPIKIPMTGYAVFSQVIFNIPRRELNQRHRRLCYRGIASITEKYLIEQQGMKKWSTVSTKSEKSTKRENRHDIRFKYLIEDGWEIIYSDDLMPTTTELELAVERTILNDHLTNNYNDLKRHSITRKYKIIPEFKVPPYKLNFGNVIVDTPVCFTLNITNVGPEPACVKVVKANLASLHANEISIEFRPKLLEVGETTQLHILLKPSLKSAIDYDDKCIRDVMYLIVTHGATIPIVITATLALPRFTFLHKCIDFGMVKLGNAFRQTVIIENRGCLTCNWDTEIRSLTQMRVAYYVIPSKGELAGFDKSIMNVYFVPEKKGFYNAEILVHVQGSPRQVRLKLCGDGVSPTLVFKDANVKFDPCIPYMTENVRDLLIQNVSTYPIEFCFSDFEKNYDEEKMLVDLFFNYHNLKTVFIPERELGSGIPEIFLSTFYDLEAELRRVFQNARSEDEMEIDVLAGYTREQIVELINKYINSFDITEIENTTDVYAVENANVEGLAIVDPPKGDVQNQKKGVVFIFHGAPFTGYLQAAFSTGRNLHIQLSNVDRIICEELVKKTTNVAIVVNNLFDESLNDYEDQPEINDWDDEYDILLKKIDIFKNSKLATKKKGGKDEKSSSKETDLNLAKTEKSKISLTLNIPLKSGKGKKGGETLLDISPEIFVELLKPTFEKFSTAMIIESLDSIFIWQPLLCFECILHGIGNMKYIHIVMLSLTLQEHITNEAQKILAEHQVAEEDVESKDLDNDRGERKKDRNDSDSKGSRSIREDNTTAFEDARLDAQIKHLMKEVPKDIDQKFKDFATLIIDIHEVCEIWDRRFCTLSYANVSKPKLDKKSKRKPGLLRFTNSLHLSDIANVGIPLLIVDNALPGVNKFSYPSIIQTLKTNSDLEKAMDQLKCSSKISIEESKYMYSVLKGTMRFNKHLSDVFKIVNVGPYEKNSEINEHTDQSQSISPAMSVIKNSKPRRKKKSSSLKSDHISTIYTTFKNSFDTFCARSIINPGEIMKYEISFHPQDFGVFSHKYRLEIIGNRLPLFVKCSAICELPNLDYNPGVMFQKSVENYTTKKIDDKFVYLIEEKVLDFGHLIVAGAKTPPYTTIMVLRNISKIPCITSVMLDDESEFKISPQESEILPDTEILLEISLEGKKKGNVDCNLYITIKNNPMVFRLNKFLYRIFNTNPVAHHISIMRSRPYSVVGLSKLSRNVGSFKNVRVRLMATVEPLDFSIIPKFLNFDKIPLDYSVKQHIKLTNSTLVDLRWRFMRCDWATRIYKINKLRGEVNMNNIDKIEFEFKPTKEEVNPQRTIEIQVFDPLCSDEVPFLVDTITLQSEAVEYLVDYIDHVDLGEIKGKVEYSFPLHIVNNGNTNVHLVLEKLSDHPDTPHQKIRRIFHYNFNLEILQPQKQSAIVIIFNPTEEIEFVEVPVFVCKFLDPNKPQNVVKSFQIKYSATVLLSKFSICPASGVHFGALELHNKRTQILLLKNIGKCNFHYNISHLELTSKAVQYETPVPRSSLRTGKTNSATKVKTGAGILNIPGYSITPSEGTLDGGQSEEITVIFQPKALGVYKEHVILSVSEPVKEHMHGKKITFYGEAAEPWIDFNNFNKMFKEHYIVNNADDLIISSDIGPYTYFVISKHTLYFENVCVKKEYNGKIYLQNLGQLIAAITLKIHNCNNFSVTPTQFTIDPYNTALITVTFKPDSINVFEGKLEIMSSATTNNTFELMLHGRSYVPQIKLSGLPEGEENDNLYKIYFKPTYINETQRKKVKIQNVSVIACQIIVDVTDSGNSMFYVLHDCDNNEKEENKDQNLVVSSLKTSLKPSESTHIYLVFKPHKEALTDTFINIYTVDNPFETNKIQVFGHCYSGDIYINTLEAFNPKGWSFNNNEISYILDFGSSPLKELQKKRFLIKNNSEKETYRFEFMYHIENLKFIPKVGHLKPMTSKEILTINQSNLPYTIKKELITFNYIPITILDNDPVSIAWDERQQLLSWIEEGIEQTEDPFIQLHFKNCVEKATDLFLKSETCERSEIINTLKMSLEREEPDVIFNSDDWETTGIFVSFTLDYALYACQTVELNFPTTFVRDKSELIFEVKNYGKVPLEIEWKIFYDEVIPKSESLELSNKPDTEDTIPADTGSSDESFVNSTNDTTLLMIHSHIFKVLPRITSIPINQSCQFGVIFSPLRACTYSARLVSDINSLHPDLRNMEIPIEADSVVPDYYFELEESDYLKTRTTMRCLKYISENLKVLEIHAVGIGTTTTKRFCVLNTSGALLSFKMEPLEEHSLSYLQCKTPLGTIQMGKKFDIIFAFTTFELGTFEEDYTFIVDNKKISDTDSQRDCDENETRFLIVGICRNPKVYFKVAHLSLTPTLLRISTQESICLRNDEDEELNFKIIKESLYSYDHLQKLKIIPSSGSILPKTEITMQLIYNAETVGDSTFSIQCVVDRMTTPLTLNVSTKCLEVECKIQYIDQSGEEITLDPNNENVINMGKIGVKTKSNMKFIFANLGKTGFFYSWHYNKSHIEHLINIWPKKDKEFISAGSSVKREVSFETYKKYNLTNFPMKIEISYGPIYNLKFNVAAEFPACKLSFTNYNFGNCLIQPFTTKHYTVPLVVKNFEPYTVKLDNVFEENENLTVDFKSELIHPKSTKSLPFYFHPKKEGQYEFVVPIVLNCTKRWIKIIGTGVKINLQLMTATDKFIDFGEVKIGESKVHKMYVINRTPTPLDTVLLLAQDIPTDDVKMDEKVKPEIVIPCLPPAPLTIKHKKASITTTRSNKTGTETGRTNAEEARPSTATVRKTSEFQKSNFYIEPRGSVRMEFNKKYEFTIEFRPNERLENFTQKIFYKIQDCFAPICSLKGKCLVPEFSLDQEILTFSNVLVDSMRVKHVLLRNTGDLPLKFKWQCDHLHYFKIHPIEGYVKQKSDIKVDFCFKINQEKCQIVKKCKCIIDSKYTLDLTLVANSINKPSPAAVVTFSCPVRQKNVEYVKIVNNTKTLWNLHPIISNKNFTVPSEICIEPDSECTIPVEYQPKQMIEEEATLILPLPDEEILYEFIGQPLPPLPEKRLTIEINSKQNHCHVLPVHNWTDNKQCFEVETVLVSTPTPKTLFKTFGVELVDLLPGETKEYKWNIYCINEEPLDLQVIFRDKQSKEYMFYELLVKVYPPKSIDSIELTTCLRSPVKTKIKLTNPVNIPVEFSITCPNPELQFKNHISIPPYTSHDLEVVYFPVKFGEFTTVIDAKCDELGTFSYAMYLSAELPTPEKTLKFLVELGSKEYATAELKNTFPVNLDINVKNDLPEFTVEKFAKTILPGETALLNVCFDPCALGILESQLVVGSNVSGPYIFPLYAECIPPTPKGPFLIKPGGSTTIHFINPFNDPNVFYYSCDSHKFEVKVSSEEIRPKKHSKIVVSCTQNHQVEGTVTCPLTGRLIVSCDNMAWIYYLQME